MSRLSSQEPEETKPDGFDVMSTRVRMDLLQTEPVVFDGMSGHLHLRRWQKNRCWGWDIGTFAGLFVATELGVFEKMSGHFYGCICAGKNTTGRSIYRPVRGDKTRYLWWHVKTTPDVFGADRTGCFSRDIWTIPDLFVADRTWCCFVATQQEMCFLCLNLTRAALSRLKIEGWTLTNMQNCHVKKRKASTYPSFAELCIADVY